jgi:hypothetical protein
MTADGNEFIAGLINHLCRESESNCLPTLQNSRASTVGIGLRSVITCVELGNKTLSRPFFEFPLSHGLQNLLSLWACPQPSITPFKGLAGILANTLFEHRINPSYSFITMLIAEQLL